MARLPAAPILLAALLAAACGVQQQAPPPGATHDAARRRELSGQARILFGSLPAAMPGAEGDTPARVALGRKLFFDPRLSVNGAQACADCHHLEGTGRSGADDRPRSIGALGRKGVRNAPTVLDAGFLPTQFWDGRAATLEEQAERPILDPDEMAMPDAAAVARALGAEPAHGPAFAAAFPGEPAPVSLRNAARALAAFERTLRTRTRLDRFLDGDLAALDDAELRGMQLFWVDGCLSCHNGPTLGGRVYHRMGLVKPYPSGDPGRFAVTHRERDRGVFRVAPLRNVPATAPYFHDGSAATLEEAVRKMAWHQLGKELAADEVWAIAAFLGTLRDEGTRDAPATAR